MTTAEIKHCLTTYKTYLESNDSKYVFVNELRYPSTEKAVKVSLFCVDFGTREEGWSDKDKTTTIYFWIPRRMSFGGEMSVPAEKIVMKTVEAI